MGLTIALNSQSDPSLRPLLSTNTSTLTPRTAILGLNRPCLCLFFLHMGSVSIPKAFITPSCFERAYSSVSMYTGGVKAERGSKIPFAPIKSV